MFFDRQDAGKQLAQALDRYRNQDVLVLAIPKGGVEIGYQVARYLDADFSLLIARKLPFPYNPEAGFGAIAEDGSSYLYPGAASELSAQTVARIAEAQRTEIQRRIQELRGGRPLPDLSGRTVILVDDGIAMGSTMRAAIKMCRAQGAARIVVAVPVAGPRVVRELRDEVDDLVVLEQPPYFRAVAQVYQNWYDVSDREALDIMAQWEKQSRD